MSKTYFIAGIGTDVGKTVASAVICKAWKATYWKPLQSGSVDGTDTRTIAELVGEDFRYIPEQYVFSEPLSPHEAAHREGVTIAIDEMQIPPHDGTLIIEGAGGIRVPVDMNGNTYLDLIKQWRIPVIVVSRHYLGSINHTLLTVDALKANGIPIAGIVYIGEDNLGNERIIQKIHGLHILGRIPQSSVVNQAFVTSQAELFRQTCQLDTDE